MSLYLLTNEKFDEIHDRVDLGPIGLSRSRVRSFQGFQKYPIKVAIDHLKAVERDLTFCLVKRMEVTTFAYTSSVSKK